MYDSITSHLIRLGRRSWIIIVIALAAGALLGALMADRRQSWTATATIQVADVSTSATLLGLGGDQGFEQDISTRPLAIRSAEDFASTANDTTVAAVADEAASVIVAVATGPDSASVETALAEFEEILERRATDPKVAEANTALQANQATLDLFRSDLEALDQQLSDLAVDDAARSALLGSRTDLLRDIRELESSGEALRQYSTVLETALVATIGTSIDGPGSAVLSMTVGVVVMAILLTVAGALLVVTDQRVRRRMQLERILPGTPVLAVIPAGEIPSAEYREAARAIDRFVKRCGCSSAVVVDLDGSGVLVALHGLATTQLAALDPNGENPDDAVIVIAMWGKSTENDVSARIASLEQVGGGDVAVIIAGVPPRDLAWAGATSRSTEPNPAPV